MSRCGRVCENIKKREDREDNKEVIIRHIQKEDVQEVTSLFLENLKTGLFFSLGREIGELIFENMVSSNKGICLVCIKDHSLVGFLTFLIAPFEFFKELFKAKPYFFIVKSIKRFIIYPCVLRNIIATSRLSKGLPKKIKAREMGGVVKREYRGQGIYVGLCKEIHRELRKNGISQYYSCIREKEFMPFTHTLKSLKDNILKPKKIVTHWAAGKVVVCIVELHACPLSGKPAMEE